MIKTLTVATRAGDLAIAQTGIIVSALKKIYPDINIKIKKITTSGDKDRVTSLWELKDSGFFTSQLEETLLAGQADFAVHSFKDLPTEQRKGLSVAAIYKRDYAQDCLVSKEAINSIEQLKPSAKIGTSSLRRAVQIKRLRSDFEIAPIRGNVQTRIRQLDKGYFDAVILARAGLERIGMGDKISLCFEPSEFISAPAQGALAVQTRSADREIVDMLACVDDEKTREEVLAEREVLTIMRCGCHAPVGVFAKIENDAITIDAFISDLQGENFIKRKVAGQAGDSIKLAGQIAKELLDAGGNEILEELKR